MNDSCSCASPPPTVPDAARAAWFTRGHVRHDDALCDLWCQLPRSASECRPHHPWQYEHVALSPAFCAP